MMDTEMVAINKAYTVTPRYLKAVFMVHLWVVYNLKMHLFY